MNVIDWFEEQAKIEKSYNSFYKCKVKEVKLTFIFVKHKKVIYIKSEKVNVQNATLTRKDLLDSIQRNHIINNETYRFFSMAKFNFTIEPEQIIKSEYSNNYFRPFHEIEDVIFLDTIEYVSDINELFIVMKTKAIQTRKNILYARKTKRKLT
jgi:hypothetical protein